ncbi:MAG: F0F1 ATP synthase subunit B, partial [Candidatus Omnitrophica bacterium]|nr:F0F1 ATP synthase subunit B [Candidatus Omnitrophota bacterium]
MKLIWQEILTNILGFLIILILLRIFAWKPILGLLDERKKRIAS